MARLLSVNVARPREISWRGQTVRTSVWKEPVQGRRLVQMAQPGSRTGNAGLASPEQMVTTAPGFRPLKVARIDRESSSVVSLVLEPADACPLTVPLAVQFVVLRLRPTADALLQVL